MERLKGLTINISNNKHNLSVYVSGGGASQDFQSGEDCKDTIIKLRHLADILERSINERSKEKTKWLEKNSKSQ